MQEQPLKPHTPLNPSATSSAEEISLLPLVQEYARHWKVYLVGIVVCLLLALLYLAMATRRYPIDMSILFVEQKNNRNSISAGELALIDIATGVKNIVVENEVQLLKSRAVVKAAVQESGAYISVRGKQGLRDRVYYRTLPFELHLDPTALQSLHEDFSFTLEAQEGGGYLVQGNSPSHGEFSAKVAGLPATFSTPYGIMSMTPRKGVTTNPVPVYHVKVTNPNTLTIYYASKGGLQVERPDRASTIVMLHTEANNRAQGEAFLNKLVQVYNRQRILDKDVVSQKTYDFLTERIAIIGSELTNTEKELEVAKKGEGITGFQDLAPIVNGRMELERTRMEAQTQLDLMNHLSSFIQNSANQYELIPNTITAGSIKDASLASAIEAYNQLIFRRNSLVEASGTQHPSIVALDQEIDRAHQSIAEAVAVARQGVQITLSSVISQQTKYAGRIASAPSFERITSDIMRQREIRSSLYLMLLKKREEISLEKASNLESAKVIDRAYSASSPTFPKRGIALLAGLLAGLVLPTLIVFLWKLTRTKIRTEAEVKALTHLPVIASIPYSKITEGKEMLVDAQSNTIMTEVFRSLRTNISFVSLRQTPLVVVVTSTTPGEGKTFVSSNLAKSFATLGKRTLLVGADVRNPQLKRTLSLDRFAKLGLTDLISDKSANIMDNVMAYESCKDLYVLHSGTIPPNPAELLSLGRLDEVFAELRQHFDYIIVDSAPVGPVVDTIIAARVADFTVYVSRAGVTQKSDFEYINYLSTEGKLPNISLVINGTDVRNKTYGKSYGYGYVARQHNDQTGGDKYRSNKKPKA